MNDPIQHDYNMETFELEDQPMEEKRSKSANLYNNGYVKRISAEEAAKEMNAGGDYGPRCAQLQADLDQAWKDFQYEEMNCKRWLAKEEEVQQTQAQLITWEDERERGTISAQGASCLQVMDSAESQLIIQNARTKRLQSQKCKDDFIKRIESLRKEIALIKSKKGMNVVFRDSAGNHCIKFGSASQQASALQSLKRDAKEIARDYCKMLCTAEGMLKISLERSIPLIVEYQNVFEVGTRDFELMTKILYRIEKEKSLMSREQFVACCWESLSKENQREHTLARRVIETDSESKYEFGLPACRERRTKKLEADKKLPGQLRRKEEIKKAEEIRKYNAVVRGGFTQRGRGRGRGYYRPQQGYSMRGYTQRRGIRGNFRGRGGRGGFQSQNYSRPRYQNQGFHNKQSYNRNFGQNQQGFGHNQNYNQNFGQNYNQNFGQNQGYINQPPHIKQETQLSSPAMQQPYAPRGGSRGRGRGVRY